MSSSGLVRGCLASEREQRYDEAGANVMDVFTLDCGDGFIVYTNFRTLNLCSLVYIIYTLVKLALKEGEKSALMNLLEGSHLSSGLHLAHYVCSFQMTHSGRVTPIVLPVPFRLIPPCPAPPEGQVTQLIPRAVEVKIHNHGRLPCK